MIDRGDTARTDRGQLSLPAVEVGIGLLLVFGVVGLLALGVPGGDGRTAQLDAYADDAATVLEEGEPRHGGATRIDELTASPERFQREAGDLEKRVDRILPDNVLFRVETPHGAVGFERPAGVPAGTASVPTLHGEVRIEVWYP